MLFSFVEATSNRKTGPIAVSMASEDSCPAVCPLKKSGCYAKYGMVGMHWRRVAKTGLKFAEFLSKIKNLAEQRIFRYGIAGDLPGRGNKIDGEKLAELTKAVSHLRAFAYTHKPVGKNHPENTEAIKKANEAGFVINLSANNLSHADELAVLNIAPVVVILPLSAAKTSFTPEGRKVIQCPQQYRDGLTCEKCGLCTRLRGVIIGFVSHGTAKNAVNKIANKKSK